MQDVNTDIDFDFDFDTTADSVVAITTSSPSLPLSLTMVNLGRRPSGLDAILRRMVLHPREPADDAVDRTNDTTQAQSPGAGGSSAAGSSTPSSSSGGGGGSSNANNNAVVAQPTSSPKSETTPNVARNPQDEATAVSVVYVTDTPSTTGAVVALSTNGPAIAATASSSSPAALNAQSEPSTVSTRDGNLPAALVVDTNAPASATSFAVASIVPTAPGAPVPSNIATAPATSSPSTAPTTDARAPSRTSTSMSRPIPTQDDNSTPAPETGISGGSKAGIAIGAILLVGALLSVILFCIKKRKSNANKIRIDRSAGSDTASRKAKGSAAAAAAADSEKNPFSNAAAVVTRSPSTRTTKTAPRLSLRPVTQFLPYDNEPQNGNGIPLADTTSAGATHNGPTTSPGGAQEQNRHNPFGSHAESIDPTNANGPAVVRGVNAGGSVITSSPQASLSPTDALRGGGAAAGVAGAVLARSASKRGLPGRGGALGPPSPTETDNSEITDAGVSTPSTSGAAIAAAGGPSNSAVHRVQLDFKPSMEDELELQAGQLVRLLHEYDDGWAMCIRLDRSRQGVVPRTCLSTRPVKPRPQPPRGPPPAQGPGMHQGPPHAGNSHGLPMDRAMSPAPLRPMSPPGKGPRPAPATTPNPFISSSQSRGNSPYRMGAPGTTSFNSSFESRLDVPDRDGNVSPVSSQSDEPDWPSNRRPLPGQAL